MSKKDALYSKNNRDKLPNNTSDKLRVLEPLFLAATEPVEDTVEFIVPSCSKFACKAIDRV